ncbi:MAG TPA: hypothetical protein VGZ04_05420 [Acidimicrobiales bacterium]|jgi:hypothetical protein|nr:hypothetical protein [Acidimicrobiales bacterium]
MDKTQRIFTLAGFVVIVILGFGLPSGAASKSSPAHVNLVSHVVKTQKVAFKGSYRGSIALLMVGASGQSATSVTVSSVTGTGTGTLLGSGHVSASGSAPASNQCDPLTGHGILSGAGGTLRFKVVSSSASQGCATGTSAPTAVTVKALATVTGGTGKYARVSGTLKFTGSFNVSTNSAGSSENDAFSAAVTGALTIKK